MQQRHEGTNFGLTSSGRHQRRTICRAGTTPDSSAVTPMLISLCHQISYNLMLPFDDIPDEMVPLTAHLKELLLNATKEQVSPAERGTASHSQ